MHGQACKQFIFRSFDASTFNAMSFDENDFTCQCGGGKEDNNSKEFQISQFYWLFSCDVMALKGLIPEVGGTA